MDRAVDNYNLSVFKNVNITESVRFQLRLEAYNVFNHTQWSTINTGLSAPTPGPELWHQSWKCGPDQRHS